MFNQTFYHDTIRKYVILFGTIFNNIYINRPNLAQNVTRSIKVPVSYGPKEKTLARVRGDPDLKRPVAIVLPRMSFELLSMNYAPTRKLITVNKNVKVQSDENLLLRQYMPVPYDFMFELSVMVNNADDGARIVEQILPFFTPDWTPSIILIPEMGLKYDIPIILNSVDVTDTYEGDYETRRALIWTLSFTLKGYVFGPLKNQGVIKEAITRAIAASQNFNLDTFEYTDDEGNVIHQNDPADVSNLQGAEVDTTFTVQPGLTANGEPTSNLANSVTLSEIAANSNYGYIITRE